MYPPAELPQQPQDAFWIDEQTGYIRAGAPDTGQLFKTRRKSSMSCMLGDNITACQPRQSRTSQVLTS